MDNSPKWKSEAASAASACPALNTSAKCSGLPAPPEAMTGMLTDDQAIDDVVAHINTLR